MSWRPRCFPDCALKQRRISRGSETGFCRRDLSDSFITLNKDGVYYKSKEKEGILRPRGDLRLVSATGAGRQLFRRRFFLGRVRGLDIEEIARMGMAAASIAMESEQAVNSNINMKELKEEDERRCIASI